MVETGGIRLSIMRHSGHTLPITHPMCGRCGYNGYNKATSEYSLHNDTLEMIHAAMGGGPRVRSWTFQNL